MKSNEVNPYIHPHITLLGNLTGKTLFEVLTLNPYTLNSIESLKEPHSKRSETTLRESRANAAVSAAGICRAVLVRLGGGGGGFCLDPIMVSMLV